MPVISAPDPSTDPRVIYETNFTIDLDCLPAFQEYLKSHIKGIIDIEGGALFDRGGLCVVEKEQEHEADKGYLCAQYRARSKWRLQEYFDKHAEWFRRDMMDKFHGKFTVQRRILTECYSHE